MLPRLQVARKADSAMFNPGAKPAKVTALFGTDHCIITASVKKFVQLICGLIESC
jgi:hypothetical protein